MNETTAALRVAVAGLAPASVIAIAPRAALIEAMETGRFPRLQDVILNRAEAEVLQGDGCHLVWQEYRTATVYPPSKI